MNIPIIGQPKVTDFFITIQIECPCKTSFMLVGAVGATRPCQNPACDKIYQLSRWPVPGPDGVLEWPLGVGVMKK